jgi:hypothetical protein
VTYPTDDLVKMRGWFETRIHKRIKTVNDELGATEPNERVCWGDERQRNERIPLHLG